VNRIAAGQQFRDKNPDVDVCRRERAFPAFDVAPERWCVGTDALSNKIAERCSPFPGPIASTPMVSIEVEAGGKKLPTRHIGCRVLPKDRPFRD